MLSNCKNASQVTSKATKRPMCKSRKIKFSFFFGTMPWKFIFLKKINSYKIVCTKSWIETILSSKNSLKQGNYLKSHLDNFSCLSLKSRAIKAVMQVLKWVCVTAFIMLDFMVPLNHGWKSCWPRIWVISKLNSYFLMTVNIHFV